MPQGRPVQFQYQKTHFAPEDALEQLRPEEQPEELLTRGRGLSKQVNRLMLILQEFLDQGVTNYLLAGYGAPNLLNNGNFLASDGTPEAPGYLPPFWDSAWVSSGMVGNYETPPVVAGQPVVPGQAFWFNVVAGGLPFNFFQRIQGSNRKTYSLSFYYKTSDLTSTADAVNVILSNTAGSTSIRNLSLPGTRGQWRFYPASEDPCTVTIEEGDTSPYVSVQIGSTSTVPVTQRLYFAGVTLVEGTQPVLFKPSALDQARCQGDTPPSSWTPQNKAGVAISPGMAVATHGSGIGVVLANAGSAAPAVGILTKPLAPGATTVAANRQGIVQTTGIVDLADWTAATGAATLTAGPYYLDTTNGLLTTTKPALPNIGQPIGRAIGPSRLALGIGSDENAFAGGIPTTANKAMVASVTTADYNLACATAIAGTPRSDGYVQVFVNGCGVELGDGVKTKDCYFSADGGATARTIAAVAVGDLLYWVGSVVQYQLAADDLVDFDYLV